MKKTVGLIMIFSVLLFCGCTQRNSGYIDELTQNEWHAALDGGGTVDLRFENDTASLTIENGGESAVISGQCIADETTFVIFMPDLAQNYGFDYVPMGDTLELRCGENSIILKKRPKKTPIYRVY